MSAIFLTFFKRIPREGFKSLAVPILAFVLVVLISIMGGTQIRLAADLEDAMDNFPVLVEVSCPATVATDNLGIDLHHIRLFTDVGIDFSLADYLQDVELSSFLFISATYPPVPVNHWIGVTSPGADLRLDPYSGVYIDFFPGYDESIFHTWEMVGVVSEEIFNAIDSENPLLTLMLRRVIPALINEAGYIIQEEVYFTAYAEIRIVGITHGSGNYIFSPFWTVGEAAESVGMPVHASQMWALMADNRQIGAFANVADRHFTYTGNISPVNPFALTIFDTIYNDITRRMQQNIQIISISTPFIYVLSILIGFIASYLLTRRRKSEFAIMRSIGVSKGHVFFGALAEQAFLCIIGAALGFVVFAVVQGDLLFIPPLLFTACYVSGSVFAAQRAAGTNVLKILREKE